MDRTLGHSAEQLKTINSALFSDHFVDRIDKLKQAVTAERFILPDAVYFRSSSLRPHFNSHGLLVLLKFTKSSVLSATPLPPQKSSSLAFIRTSLIKCYNSVSVDIVATLANLSFEQGNFPTSYKAAVVTPLLKKSDLDAPLTANYCQISDLNNISKVFKKLFMAGMSLINYNLLIDHVTHTHLMAFTTHQTRAGQPF